MGYWTNTTYIKSQSIENITNVLSEMFAEEGMALVSSPDEINDVNNQAMQYSPALKNNLWGIAIFPGSDNWVVIKTAPLELLGEKEPNSNKIRLASLCQHLQTSGFMYNLYDSDCEILVETDGTGSYHISGLGYDSPDEYHGEELDIDETDGQIQFIFLPFQEILDKNPGYDERADVLATLFGGENSRYCDNLISFETLISRIPFEAKGGQVLYYKWTNESRES